MKPLTLEWIDKAEGDWISAQRELRAPKVSKLRRFLFSFSAKRGKVSKSTPERSRDYIRQDPQPHRAAWFRFGRGGWLDQLAAAVDRAGCLRCGISLSRQLGQQG
jgi:hypothetical protein